MKKYQSETVEKPLFRQDDTFGGLFQRSHFIIVLVFVLFCFNSFVFAADDATQTAVSMEQAFTKVAHTVGPAVVSISSEHVKKIGPRAFSYHRGGPFDDEMDEFLKRFFGEMPSYEYKSLGLGSGVIIDKEGYILTNEHVIKDASSIKVTLSDGRDFQAEVKGSDPRSDIAVLKIKAQNLPAAELGDSDQVKIGQWAIAIGNPFGFAVNNPQPTVTVGVISALHRSLPLGATREKVYLDLIQTDAAINPGNSGGPLMDIQGKIIGINVAIFSTSGGNIGIGFAIPINTAKAIISDLIEGKEIKYGWLGIAVQDINDKLAQYFKLPEKKGALVVSVAANTPAAKAGLRSGDIITAVNGKPLVNSHELITQVSRAPIGGKLSLEVLRENKSLKIDCIVEEKGGTGEAAGVEPKKAEAKKKAGLQKPWRGIAVIEITPQIMARYNLESQKGVLVTNVIPGSPADEAGIEAGDIIEAINNVPIAGIEAYEKATAAAGGRSLIKTHRGYVIIDEKE